MVVDLKVEKEGIKGEMTRKVERRKEEDLVQ